MIVDAVRRYHQFQRHVRALEVMGETCGRKLGLFSEAASSRGTVHDRLRTLNIPLILHHTFEHSTVLSIRTLVPIQVLNTRRLFV